MIFSTSRTKLARRRDLGFTLLELMVVIAIMVLLLTLIVGSLGSGKANNVTNAGNQIMEDMALARELAISNDSPTEIWFLQPNGAGLTPYITATRIYTVDQNGNDVAYGPVHPLPIGLMVDSDGSSPSGTTLSNLFGSGTLKSWDNTGTSSQSQPIIPGYGTNYKCWYVRFMPDGSTTLGASQQWYLTLHDQKSGDGLTTGNWPSNYAMVSIDPVTGAVKLYRP